MAKKRYAKITLTIRTKRDGLKSRFLEGRGVSLDYALDVSY